MHVVMHVVCPLCYGDTPSSEKVFRSPIALHVESAVAGITCVHFLCDFLNLALSAVTSLHFIDVFRHLFMHSSHHSHIKVCQFNSCIIVFSQALFFSHLTQGYFKWPVFI